MRPTMHTICILIILTMFINWGCEKSVKDTTSSQTEQGPCPAEFAEHPYDSPPEISWFVAVPYPDSSRALGHEGRVGLHVCVGNKGGVQDVKVRQSSGWSELDQIAHEYAFKNRYIPGELNYRPICMWMIYHVDFTLPDSSGAKPINHPKCDAL